VVLPVLVEWTFMEIHMRDRKKETDESISKALDVAFEVTKEIVPEVLESDEISSVGNADIILSEECRKVDFKDARTNLLDLIGTGKIAIEGILSVAENGDAPRAYEVVSQLLKTVSEMNNDLIGIHQKASDINKIEYKQNNTTNNSIYVGSTSDLQDLINQSRSRNKLLQDEIESTDDG